MSRATGHQAAASGPHLPTSTPWCGPGPECGLLLAWSQQELPGWVGGPGVLSAPSRRRFEQAGAVSGWRSPQGRPGRRGLEPGTPEGRAGLGRRPDCPWARVLTQDTGVANLLLKARGASAHGSQATRPRGGWVPGQEVGPRRRAKGHESPCPKETMFANRQPPGRAPGPAAPGPPLQVWDAPRPRWGPWTASVSQLRWLDVQEQGGRRLGVWWEPSPWFAGSCRVSPGRRGH